jgi:hypothetical protein
MLLQTRVTIINNNDTTTTAAAVRVTLLPLLQQIAIGRFHVVDIISSSCCLLPTTY